MWDGTDLNFNFAVRQPNKSPCFCFQPNGFVRPFRANHGSKTIITFHGVAVISLLFSQPSTSREKLTVNYSICLTRVDLYHLSCHYATIKVKLLLCTCIQIKSSPLKSINKTNVAADNCMSCYTC